MTIDAANHRPAPPTGCCSITDQLDGRYVAPRRFDAYEVEPFLHRLAAEPGHLVVDCSEVEFLDLSAHRALFGAVRRGSVTVLDPSAATLLTCDLVAAASEHVGIAA
ncbi:hypothetical protein BDK89_1606 [Ilumatobacter fluminis]|uniref:STAS domain-containing protein n=1 Tax=Ilumatobacter fluminis TaxID=467091 RepID=A0A4R7HZ72_9ACTN|nr:hypothetical protein [Ilumatobacter fluminis]TDT16024.1 hypothetical protein BDK89_1606 [Ilumatobacter fluminis]